MNLVVQSRFKKLQDDVSYIGTYRSFLQQQLDQVQADVKNLRYKADLYQRCSEVIKMWLEDSLQANIDSIADLATSGLRHIINDQNLTFKIQQEHKHNKISMRFVINDNGVEGDPIDSFGGGPVSVISLIIRLAVMARMNMGNLLILDESMAALANQYVPAAASFMRQLADQTGVNILMVTHNDEFMNHAHKAYEGDKNSDGEMCLQPYRIV